jgi:RNA polymerase sigma-70 factor (ECF subfamily)
VDDEELMLRFTRGDEAAFVELHTRYAGPLLGFLRRMLRDPALAEDVLQTTFLHMVRARGRYEPGMGVRPWFFAIAANAARDALRRRKVRGERPMNEEIDPSFEPALPDPALAKALGEALGALPAEQREAVLLHKLEGLSFDEIGRALGITTGAAKLRAHRGYEKLRAALGDRGDAW